jgi:hypothetical protein
MHIQTRIGLAIAFALYASAPAEAAKRYTPPTQMNGAPVLSGAPAAAIGGAEFSLASTGKRHALPLVSLPPPSNAEIRRFQEARARNLAEGKAYAIGFSRATPDRGGIPLSQLAWQPLPDGRLATQFKLSSAGARAIRAELALKANAAELRRTTIRYGGDDGRVFERSGADFIGQRTVWSPHMRGATGTIEIVLPRGARPERFQLRIPRLNHLDVDPLDDIARQIPANGGFSAFCHQDTVCRLNPTQGFRDAQNAVAQMTFVSNADGRSYVCTGTLLDNARVPKRALFWTAAHCIDSAFEAQSLDTIWFFRATACRGNRVAPGAVELTGGARLLHADASRDTSLLELAEAPPQGAFHAGYNSAAIGAINTVIEGLHHPRGDTMMYSIGAVNNLNSAVADPKPWNPLNQIQPLYRVSWNTGITEGGSSGSGLFTLTAEGAYQLRGGLWGGSSSCANPRGNDYYSQLSGVWNTISQHF